MITIIIEVVKVDRLGVGESGEKGGSGGRVAPGFLSARWVCLVLGRTAVESHYNAPIYY